MRNARVVPIVVLLVLAACETTNSSDWVGGNGTPFKQAERSCREELKDISKADNGRDFFIGCMGALGWAPRPGASIDL
jgi:hypothetical protein